MAPDPDNSGEFVVQPPLQQFSWWDQHAGKVLAGVAIAVILGFGGWLIQVDRNTVKTNFLLEQIGKDIGELRTGLKTVDVIDKRVNDNKHAIDDVKEDVERLEARVKDIEKHLNGRRR